MKDSDISRPVWEEGMKHLKAVAIGEAVPTDKTKLLLAGCMAHVKMMATEANQDTNRLGLAKMIYSDPKNREQYFKKTMPHMMIESRKK